MVVYLFIEYYLIFWDEYFDIMDVFLINGVCFILVMIVIDKEINEVLGYWGL